jgi:4-amino-4-deoxy-L-arabinose transferase-like glycosyltransferase
MDRSVGVARPFRTALVVITVTALVKIVVAGLFPPPPDETYYWEWSRRLAGGYLDHPPAIALLVRVGSALFGASPLGIRLGAVLAGWGASLCVVLLARRLSGDAAALRAAVIIACIPLAAAGLVVATPDAPLLAATALSLLALDHAIAAEPGSRRALRWWLVAGASLGVALGSKYSAVLLPAGVLLALVTSPVLRRQLVTPAPYLATLLALLIFAPVVQWNATHDWISFRFQLGHGLGPHNGSLLAREASLLGSQAALVSPVLFVLMGVVVVSALRNDAPRQRMLAVVAATFFLFFCVTTLRQPAEANWQAPAYIPAIVLLASHSSSRRWLRWLAAGCALGGVMVATVYLQAVSPFLPIPAEVDPTARGTGWRELAAKASDAAASVPAPPGSTTWLAGNRYQVASQLAFHLPDHPQTFSLNVESRTNQYDLWPSFQEQARAGDNLVLVLDGDYDDDPVIATLRPHFAHVRPFETVILRRGGEERMRCRVWVLEGWRDSR